MYSYLLNLTIEASRLIAKLETMVVTFSIRATTVFSHVPSNGTELVRFYDASFLWQFSSPPTSPVLLPALVPPDFTKQSLVCTLLLHRSNVEATRVPACRERRQMPVKWPALQSLAQTRTGFQLDDALQAQIWLWFRGLGLS